MRVGASQITRIFPPWEESGRRAGRAGRAASLSLEDDEEERGEEGMKPHMYKNPKRRFFFLFFFYRGEGGEMRALQNRVDVERLEQRGGHLLDQHLASGALPVPALLN